MATTIQVLRSAEEASIALDPIRQKLLSHLEQPGSAASLARVLNLPRQKINYHLHELERAGLVREAETRRRGSVVERLVVATAKYYLVSPEALGKLGAGTHDPDAGLDRNSSGYLLSTMSRGIRDLVELRYRADQAGMRLSTMTLETEIRFRTPSDRNAFTQELTYLVSQLVAQYHDTTSPDARKFRFVIGSYPYIAPVEPGQEPKAAVTMD